MTPGAAALRDVIVIGGGITGASLAYWLGRTGVRTVLLERDEPASGATGRNAGFLLAGVAANYADAVQVYGRPVAREVWAFTRENHAMLAAALADSEVGYRQAGSWIVAADEYEALDLQTAHDLMRDDGFESEWVADPPGLVGAHFGALSNPGDGELDSAAAVRALLDRAIGVEVRTGSDVRDLTDLDASHVIVATNAWAPELLPEIPIRPIRAQMLETAPLDRVVADRPVYSDRGYRYWRQLPDGRLLLGGFRDGFPGEASAGYVAQPTDPVQARLDQHLRELDIGAPVQRRWAGIMGFTPDQLPIVGAVAGRQRTWISAGYSGHGMGFAFLAARHLVDHIVHGAALPLFLSPSRPFVTNGD